MSVGCSCIEFKVSAAGSTSETKPKVLSQVLQPTQMRFAREALPNPNVYRIDLSLTNPASEQFFVRKQRFGTSAQHLSSLSSNTVGDSEVEASAKYTVEIRRIRRSTFVRHQREEIEIPKDIVPTGLRDLSTDLKNATGRVFILEGFVTSIGRNGVMIEA